VNYFAGVRENFGRTLVTMKMASSGFFQKKLCSSWMKSVMLQYWNIVIYFVQISFMAMFSILCELQLLQLIGHISRRYNRRGVSK